MKQFTVIYEVRWHNHIWHSLTNLKRVIAPAPINVIEMIRRETGGDGIFLFEGFPLLQGQNPNDLEIVTVNHKSEIIYDVP